MVIATRGSELALAQANQLASLCRKAFPERRFEVRTYRTTGDRLQKASMTERDSSTKGLFTKELEEALLREEAHLAVHSLKDLPTELPGGLELAGVLKREDPRDVLVCRDREWVESMREGGAGEEEWRPGQKERSGFSKSVTVDGLPRGATVATSSSRREAQLKDRRPDLTVVPIRGNVGTRLRKLMEQPELDATILAHAGMRRLGFRIDPGGWLYRGTRSQFEGFRGAVLPVEEMVPCPGQAAIGIEIRGDCSSAREVADSLNQRNTWVCVRAERAFLNAMGGGCQSPIAAYARIVGHELLIQAVSFQGTEPVRGQLRGLPADPENLGTQLAQILAS